MRFPVLEPKHRALPAHSGGGGVVADTQSSRSLPPPRTPQEMPGSQPRGLGTGQRPATPLTASRCSHLRSRRAGPCGKGTRWSIAAAARSGPGDSGWGERRALPSRQDATAAQKHWPIVLFPVPVPGFCFPLLGVCMGGGGGDHALSLVRATKPSGSGLD